MNLIVRRAAICLVIGGSLAALLAAVAQRTLPQSLGLSLAVIMAPGLWLEIERSTPYHISTVRVILVNALFYAILIGIVWAVAIRSRRRDRSVPAA